MIPRNLRKRLDLPGLAIWGVAALFVAASGAMSIAFALKMGDGGPWALVFVLVALATQSAIALWWPTTFGRGKIGTGLIALIGLVPCFMFSWGAAYDVARSNFAEIAAARETGGTALAEARAAVDRARGDLEPVADAPTGEIARQQVPVNVWTRTKGCTDVTIPASQAACAPWLNAKARAIAEANLAAALERLSAIDVAAAPAGDDGGPAFALASSVGALAGVTIQSFYQLMGWLMMLVTEIGAAVGPLVAALAAHGQVSTREKALTVWARTHGDSAPEFLSGPKASAPRLGAGPETPKIRDARAWVGECIEGAPGHWVPYKTLHKAYSDWARATGAEPIAYNHLGAILSEELGLTKYKCGTVSYIGIRLKPASAASSVPAQADTA